MSEAPSVLVTGATGNQGGALARALLGRRHHVRALARRPDSFAAQELHELGAEVMTGDFDDSSSLERAAQGMDTIFILTTPQAGEETETSQGIRVANAAKRAGVTHLIYSSVSDADRDTGIPHFESKYKVENHIAGLGVGYTIVAPVFIMDNLLSPFLYLRGLQRGVFAMAIPADRLLQQIPLVDIAEFDAFVVRNSQMFLGARVNIASDVLTGTEVSEILSRVTGRDISFSQISLESVRERSEDAALMLEWFDRHGYTADIQSLRGNYPGVEWHTFEEWAKTQDWSVLD